MLRRLALATCVLLAACGARPNMTKGPDLEVILNDIAAAELSDYGLFADLAAAKPAPGVVPYDLINPLFSDHALKTRYVFVPEGKQARYSQTDALDFPVGTVLVKTFSFAPDMRTPDTGRYKVETRLLIHKEDGWAAFPYVWNEAGTDAVYAPAGKMTDISVTDPAGEPLTIRYAVPNKNQCKTCHQSGDAVLPIGPKARNLNHDGPSGLNQLTDWQTRGILDGVPARPPAVPDVWDVSLPIEGRARAYLDINCAHCHKADGSASNSGLFLDWNEQTPVTYGVGKHPTAAGRGSGGRRIVIDPGHPETSILSFRMASDEAGIAMPELGRSVVDERGLAIVNEWIASLEPAQ
ncbi:SO2930 family diheme c-type cytochrome [Hyphomonas pacifica]|uniref:Cytochrome c domain-containing protein n=2 Tax=Hyphomonas pacifica TaxID=1280941 RepID=A0A062TRZ8_9PROT|nr:SO2930 family diheme c-type cytochrome [Hyphomonas pacifica]KCZ50611.1 hypothetical protein HY2_13590 [Hyphomonas pacifica]RAN33036.1 hypothetical protein HY3_13845 [Hyphomonas pacifica]RAN37592.1 hypothetical protein HY11_08890 [Hyphomonas pacifica]